MPWFELFYAGLSLILGASIGSFLNVVVYRLPLGLSLLHPPSRCPKCYTPLKAKDNIPVFGWLLLQGQCRYCSSHISARYPLVEFITAALFGIAFAIFGFSWMTLGSFVLIPCLVALALIDLDLMILPNVLTQWGMIAGLLFQGILAVTNGEGFLNGLFQSLFSAILGLLIFDALRIIGSAILRQQAMGGGDAKLAALIGAWLGWKMMLLSSFLACLVGSIIGVGGIALGLISRRQPIPFGPYLVLGAIAALFVGQPLLNWYVGLLGFSS